MTRPPPHRPAPALLTIALAAALALAACGGESGDDDHDDHHIDTAGRLAIAEVDAPTLRIHDLDSAAAVATFTLANTPSAVYASPGGRYALALQRTQDTTQVVDGGIWQEDHGDHDHDYRRDPQLLALRLDGPQPTHYDDRAGQASLFMDGRAATNQNAAALVFTDATLDAGNLLASLTLDLPMHGFAEPNGEHLVVSWRDPANSSPIQLALYQRQGASYGFVQRFDAQCPGMHGSYTQGRTTVTGCSDGVLLAAPDAAGQWSARHLPAPARISTIAGHPELERFVGIGNAGTPSTTLFFDIDPAAGSVTPITIAGWTEGRLRRAHAFDRAGERLFVLDDQGTLYLLQHGTGGWTTAATLASAVPAMPTAAPFPAFATNGARDTLYLSDPVGRQLLVLDGRTAQLTQRVALGFAPSYLAWLGIAR